VVSGPVDVENYLNTVELGFTYLATDALPSLGVELSMAHAQEAGLASEASCSLAGQVPACQVRPGDRPPQDGSSLRIARPAAGGSPSRVHLHVRGDVRAHPCVPRSLCGSEGDHGPADGPLNPMPESQILSMGLSGTSQEHGLILTSVGHRVSGSGRSGADTLSPSPLAHMPDMLHGPGSVEHRVDGSKGRRSGTPLSSPPPHLIAKPVMQHGPSSVEHRVGGWEGRKSGPPLSSPPPHLIALPCAPRSGLEPETRRPPETSQSDPILEPKVSIMGLGGMSQEGASTPALGWRA
jgi:hypothetical protein